MDLPFTFTVVADKDRMDFLPKHCGNVFPFFERTVFDFARAFCTAYKGGYWQFYECSNGAFFMAPDSDESFRIFVSGNGFEGVLSAKAFGITLTLFALNYLAARDRAMAEKHDLLVDFLVAVPDESGLIQRAID